MILLRKKEWSMNYNEIEILAFKENFSPEVLKKYSGIELLKLLAYPKNPDNNIKEQFKKLYEENYNSLKNELENGMTDFGSGSAGFDTNFVLAYRQGSWHNLKKKISFNEAIKIAENIKSELIQACSYLENNNFNEFYDYVSKSTSGLFNKGYTHKYFYILYPEYISFYHAGSWQQYFKERLKLPASYNFYDIEKYLIGKYPNCNVGEKSKELEDKYGLPYDPQCWLRSANSNMYDHKGAFDKFGFIDWRQHNKFKVRDIVYIYSSSNDKRIRYKTIVEKTDIPFEEINDDKEFWNNTEEYEKSKKGKYVRLKLLKESDDPSLSYENLKKLNYINNAPQGSIKITDNDFIKFLNNHFEGKTMNMEKAQENCISIPLNQILYGPPGTGKTYNTVIKAMEIINPNCIEYNEKGYVSNYSDVKKKFDKAKNNHQIEFVTFHQSYSYEEFVEGIKPDLDSKDVKYILNEGIFKVICKNAKQIKTDKTSNAIDFTTTRIFKMSLGANWENETEDIYNYCLNNNVVALGWGRDKDFSNCNTIEDFKTLDDTWGAKAVEIFKNWMRIGDIILISNGNSNIKAIAQITGEYEFHNDREIRYCQFRNVKWLYSGEDIPVSKFYDKKLSQQSIYGFYLSEKEGKQYYNSTIDTNILNEIITGNINRFKQQPYVLIIDEINRGNISKIFGELITLIEEDKRENLSVQLPYSHETFTVPKNLYIIGTMNTSDRSIASIDIALRRRFKFKEMMPKSDLVADFGVEFNKIFDDLNNKIKLLLDRDHQIGHSYFINTKYNNENGNNNISTLKEIWFSEILPLLNEYFYCDWEKLNLIIPNFLVKLEVPPTLKNECEDSMYEFMQPENMSEEEFKKALTQKEF